MKSVNKLIDFVVVFMVVMVAFCSVSFAATLGEKLDNPESGWQRIDDAYPKIKYIGTWVKDSSNGKNYNGTEHYTKSSGSQVSFIFFGNKIRLIGAKQPPSSENVKIKIDGVEETFSTKYPDTIFRCIYFEKLNLVNGYHRVEIQTTESSKYFNFDAIDIDDTGYLSDLNIPKLTATAGNAKVDLSWAAVEGATSYNIKRAPTAGGPYTTIATSTAITHQDTTVTNGTTYYYVVSAIVSEKESLKSNEVSVTPLNLDVTLEVTSVDKAKVGDEIIANVVIHNATNICAEDIKLAFDTTRLDFISAENTEADGIKIYREDDLANGIRRYITASLGKVNAANGEKVLLKLTFKTKAVGEAKIDITNGRIADNATLEKDIEEANCGEKIVLIEGMDVNRSGEFTLLDLGIDAWYYECVATDTDISKYDADQDANGIIDDADLIEIVSQILKNPNYPAPTQG